MCGYKHISQTRYRTHKHNDSTEHDATASFVIM